MGSTPSLELGSANKPEDLASQEYFVRNAVTRAQPRPVTYYYMYPSKPASIVLPKMSLLGDTSAEGRNLHTSSTCTRLDELVVIPWIFREHFVFGV